MHKRRHLTWVGIGLLGLSLIGCTPGQGRTVIEQNGETTTVIDSSDAIRPQKGAAKLQQTLENFEGYGWFDQSTVVGYQYSDSLFGDDRGIAYRPLKGEATRFFEGFSGKPEMVGLSLEGTKLALVKEGSGRDKPLMVLDLVTQKSLSYPNGMGFTPWQFNWFEDGSGAALTPIDSQTNQLSVIDPQGNLTQLPLSYSPKKRQGEGYISLGTALGKRGDYLYFLVYSDDSGIYRYNLKDQTSTQVLAQDTVSQFALAPKQDYMAITSFKKSGTGSELTLYSLEGKLLYPLYKALNFGKLLWSPEGEALIFEAIETSGDSSLYLANLQTGQSQFLGSYKGYSIKQLAFSPSGDQLMVSFINGLTEAKRIDTQIFSLPL